MNKIVVATITCDFKRYSIGDVMANNLALDVPDGWEKLVYLNIQSRLQGTWIPYLYHLVTNHENFDWDLWGWQSGWHTSRVKDQDQAHRLPSIVMARNMAREFALAQGADAILYVDSDVLIPKNSIERLLEANRSVVGGLVPGRGVHSHVYYFPRVREHIEEHMYRVPHGTAGFVLIKRGVFRDAAWKWDPDAQLSEDRLFGMEHGWYLLDDLEAKHLDNPERPLTWGEAAGF